MVKLNAVSILPHSTIGFNIKAIIVKFGVGGSGNIRVIFVTRLANGPRVESIPTALVCHSVVNKTRVGTGMARMPINLHQCLDETTISWRSLF